MLPLFTPGQMLPRPTKMSHCKQQVNRRLFYQEEEYNAYLESIRLCGYNTLKPPGIKKTMAVLVQEAQDEEEDNEEMDLEEEIDEQEYMQHPNASPNISAILPDRSSFVSWQTVDDESYSLPSHNASAANADARPPMQRSTVLDFSHYRDYDESIYHSSIHIHQDSSLM